MNSNDDVYHAPPYQDFSPICDDVECVENWKMKRPLKNGLNLFDGHDAIFCYGKTFEKWHNWAMPLDTHTTT
jgi:hypothetical protein